MSSRSVKSVSFLVELRFEEQLTSCARWPVIIVIIIKVEGFSKVQSS